MKVNNQAERAMKTNRVIVSGEVDEMLNKLSNQRKVTSKPNRSKQDIIAELVRKLYKREIK